MWDAPRTRSEKSQEKSLRNIAQEFGIDTVEEIQGLLETISVSSGAAIKCGSWREVTNELIGNFRIELQRRKDLEVVVVTEALASMAVDEKEEDSVVVASSSTEPITTDRPRAKSSDSMGSNAAVSATRSREILLGHNSSVAIIPDSTRAMGYKLRSKTEFYFNKTQRAKTYLPGNSQGNHVSSYIAIMMAFVHTITSEAGVDQAIESFRNVGLRLLSDDAEAVNYLKGQRLHSLLLPEGRAQGLDCIPLDMMTPIYNVEGEEVQMPLRLMMEKAAISERVEAKARLVDNLGNYVLRGIQQSQDFTVYSKGRIDARKDEGAVAKDSIRGLIVLDKLCYLSRITDPYQFEEEILSFLLSLDKSTRDEVVGDDTSLGREVATELAGERDLDDEGQDAHIMRYGMNAWFRDKGTTADALKERLSRADTPEGQKNILNQMIGELIVKDRDEQVISGFMEGLFDYDRVVVFDCQKAFPLSKAEINSINDDLAVEIIGQELGDQGIHSLRSRKITTKIKDKIRDQFAEEFLESNIEVDVTYDAEKKSVSGIVTLERSDVFQATGMIIKHLDIMDIICKNMISHNVAGPKYALSKVEFAENAVLINGGWNEVPDFGQHALSIRVGEQIEMGNMKLEDNNYAR